MNTIKTIISTGAIITAFALNTAQANGFFNPESAPIQHQQVSTFDDSKHEGTAFWGYYNKDLTKEAHKMDKVASFDASKHVGNPFWDYHNN